jgi:hypothetical protein
MFGVLGLLPVCEVPAGERGGHRHKKVEPSVAPGEVVKPRGEGVRVPAPHEHLLFLLVVHSAVGCGRDI